MAKSDCRICYGRQTITVPSIFLAPALRPDGQWKLAPITHHVVPCLCATPLSDLMKALQIC
jgi:hypothetical protein